MKALGAGAAGDLLAALAASSSLPLATLPERIRSIPHLDNLSVGVALELLVADPLLLDRPSRVAAVFWLAVQPGGAHTAVLCTLAQQPFQQTADDVITALAMRGCIGDPATLSPFGQVTPAQLLAALPVPPFNDTERAHLAERARALRLSIEPLVSSVPAAAPTGPLVIVPHVVVDGDPSSSRDHLAAAVACASARAPTYVEPLFALPPPPMYAVQPSTESAFAVPPVIAPLVTWDAGMLEERVVRPGALMDRATREPLSPTQQQDLLNFLEGDAPMGPQLQISAVAFGALVEHNPLVAVQLVVRVIRTNRALGTQYVSELVSREVTIHSTEVFNRLTTACQLPIEVIQHYISNCIRTCENKASDKALQGRLVRIVCVFLQALIRNRIVDPQDLMVEVQPFCIEFSRVREAAILYQLLRSAEAAGAFVAAHDAVDRVDSR